MELPLTRTVAALRGPNATITITLARRYGFYAVSTDNPHKERANFQALAEALEFWERYVPPEAKEPPPPRGESARFASKARKLEMLKNLATPKHQSLDDWPD